MKHTWNVGDRGYLYEEAIERITPVEVQEIAECKNGHRLALKAPEGRRVWWDEEAGTFWRHRGTAVQEKRTRLRPRSPESDADYIEFRSKIGVGQLLAAWEEKPREARLLILQRLAEALSEARRLRETGSEPDSP